MLSELRIFPFYLVHHSLSSHFSNITFKLISDDFIWLTYWKTTWIFKWSRSGAWKPLFHLRYWLIGWIIIVTRTFLYSNERRRKPKSNKTKNNTNQYYFTCVCHFTDHTQNENNHSRSTLAKQKTKAEENQCR